MVLKNIIAKLSKKTKIAIASIVSICVVAIVIAVVYFTNSVTINNYVVYMFMPKTITAEEMNTNYDLHVRMNKDYDPVVQENEPLEAYEYYYTDPQSGEMVVVKGGTNAVINGEDVPIYLGFLLKARMNMNTFSYVVKYVAVVIALVLVAVGIVLWFKSWSRREDEAKARKYKNRKK